MFNIRSKIEKKLLNYFFLNENSKVYINEIARIIEEDPKNVYRILKKLENNGILNSSFMGKERFFYINKNYVFLNEFKSIFRKTEGLEVILKETLKSIEGIKEAYIFGTYAGKKITNQSDIDVLIINEIEEMMRICDCQLIQPRPLLI